MKLDTKIKNEMRNLHTRLIPTAPQIPGTSDGVINRMTGFGKPLKPLNSAQRDHQKSTYTPLYKPSPGKKKFDPSSIGNGVGGFKHFDIYKVKPRMVGSRQGGERVDRLVIERNIKTPVEKLVAPTSIVQQFVKRLNLDNDLV